jgi:transcriptional regulator with XRE-family HTH domain
MYDAHGHDSTHATGKDLTTFGNYVKQLRLDRRITLRAFSEEVNMDPGNYSKIERGRSDPPRDGAKLDQFRKALGLDSNSEEWRELRRLAAIDRGELPPRILNDQQLMAKLPALFRTLEGEPIDEALLDELIATIKREY